MPTGRAAFVLALAASLPSLAAGIQTQALLVDMAEALAIDRADATLNVTLPAEQELIADISNDATSIAVDMDNGESQTPVQPLDAKEVMLHGKSRLVMKGSRDDKDDDTVEAEDEKEKAQRHSNKMTLGALAALIVCAAVPVLSSQGLVPFLAVLAYIVSLVAVKLCVKEIFKSGFPYPYATTAMHMLVTAIVASCIEWPNKAGAKSTFLISVVKAASLALNNMALVFGTAAFVSILGACTPATTFAVEVCRFGSTTTSKILSIMAVCTGAALCVKGELSFSLVATLLTLGACLCRSLKTVWSHDLMQVDMSPYRLAAWTAIWSFVLMAIATLIKEGLTPFRVFPGTSTHTKVVFFVGAILATVLNILMCFVLKYLGPLQQNIFGQLELVAVLTLAMAWLHETVTIMQWMGVVLIGLGCVLSKMDSLSMVKKLIGRNASQPSIAKMP